MSKTRLALILSMAAVTCFFSACHESSTSDCQTDVISCTEYCDKHASNDIVVPDGETPEWEHGQKTPAPVVLKCASPQIQCLVNNQLWCIDPLTNNQFCGATGDCQGQNAGTHCDAGTTCINGTCQISCLANQLVCGNDNERRCIDPLSDNQFCGAKLGGTCHDENDESDDYQGVACPDDQSCQNGTCKRTCSSHEKLSEDGLCYPLSSFELFHWQEGQIGVCVDHYADCDGDQSNGCETDLFNDDLNCGECENNVAPHQTCKLGEIVCLESYDDCDGDSTNGCETNIFDDINNCGACGYVIQNASCRQGKPLCLQHYANCDDDPSNGCETNLFEDLNNCGACGHVAHNAICMSGILTCNHDYDNCDGDPRNGCEANLLDDKNNCGACGNVVQNASCMLGKPYCKPDYGDCDGDPTNGCETNIFDDQNNCGACGNVAQHARCMLGEIECEDGYGNCDGDPTNGCETNIFNDNNNCGSCNYSCPLHYSCLGGKCTY